MQVADTRNEFRKYIETELQQAYEAAEMVVDEEEEIKDVYAGKSGGKSGVRSLESGVPVIDTASDFQTTDSRLQTPDSSPQTPDPKPQTKSPAS
jgi:hypothetical protein